MIDFPYRKEKSDIFGTIYRPIVAVNFIIGDIEIMEMMYVDSGADITLISKSVGELLGLEYSEDEVKQIYTVSRDTIPIVVKSVPMKIGKHQFNARIAWSLKEDVPLLLGRMDIFDKFEIIFDEFNKKTAFKWKDE